MRICDSEENRRKLAWLVPGYILLAWFFCVVFQPLSLNNVPGHGNNNDLNDESLYEIINLQDDPQVWHGDNNETWLMVVDNSGWLAVKVGEGSK